MLMPPDSTARVTRQDELGRTTDYYRIELSHPDGSRSLTEPELTPGQALKTFADILAAHASPPIWGDQLFKLGEVADRILRMVDPETPADRQTDQILMGFPPPAGLSEGDVVSSRARELRQLAVDLTVVGQVFDDLANDANAETLQASPLWELVIDARIIGGFRARRWMADLGVEQITATGHTLRVSRDLPEDLLDDPWVSRTVSRYMANKGRHRESFNRWLARKAAGRQMSETEGAAGLRVLGGIGGREAATLTVTTDPDGRERLAVAN